MNLFVRLTAAAVDADQLEKFIEHNEQDIFDWFSQLPHHILLEVKPDFRSFFLSSRGLLLSLDMTKSANLAFLTIVLDIAEQLGETEIFRVCHTHVIANGAIISHRLTAAARYMIGVKKAEDYLDRYDAIYEDLETAFINEEDNDRKILSTLINYYIQVIRNFGEFNPDSVLALKQRITYSLAQDEFSFLNCPLIHEVLATDTTDFRTADLHIRTALDVYLEKDITLHEIKEGYFMEEGTDYCTRLKEVNSEFDDIRNLSVASHAANPLQQNDYNSLQRGVKIVDREGELFAYMVAFGPMHSRKLLTAFPSIPFETFDQPVHIVDWGCGQGTASMVLLDYLAAQGIDLNIATITLIEPSDIALQRASLHTDKFDNTTRLITINKLLDQVNTGDFKISAGITVHLFSNILDIDAVSLKRLTNLIKTTFKGENYFVCVSPYVTELKKHRLDIFMLSFDNRHLEILDIKNNKAGTWEKTWTRVCRIFKATL